MALDLDLIFRQTFIARAEHHRLLGSTNDRARAAAHEPGELPLLVVAEEQTAGRGRGANRWWTGSGGLAFSVLLDIGSAAVNRSRSPMIGLAAALAIVRTIQPLLEPRVAGLHWPNDVFVETRKLAGVLVECLSERRCVVGIGVNTNNRLDQAPPDVRHRAATLVDLTGTEHDQTAILVDILNNLAQLLETLRCDPSRLAAQADAVCLQHGEELTVDSGCRTIRGVCRGIAADGALVLDTHEGLQLIYSGTLRHAAILVSAQRSSAPRSRRESV